MSEPQETRNVAQATVEAVLTGIANGEIEVPERFTGLENLKTRPKGEWVFDEATQEELDQLKKHGYNGQDPTSRGEVFALLHEFKPRKKRGPKPKKRPDPETPAAE